MGNEKIINVFFVVVVETNYRLLINIFLIKIEKPTSPTEVANRLTIRSCGTATTCNLKKKMNNYHKENSRISKEY